MKNIPELKEKFLFGYVTLPGRGEGAWTIWDSKEEIIFTNAIIYREENAFARKCVRLLQGVFCSLIS